MSTIAAVAAGLSAPWLLLAPSWVAYAVIVVLLVVLLAVFALSRRSERD